MLLYGGVPVVDKAADPMAELFVFNSTSNAWQKPRVMGHAPPPRSCHSAAAFGNTVVVFGGRGADGAPLDDLWVFDIQSSTWVQRHVTGSAPSARFYHAAVAAGSKMVVYGGSPDARRAFDDVWVLDTGNWQWAKLDVKGSAGPRMQHTMVHVNTKNYVYVFGGTADGAAPSSDLLILDVAAAQWRTAVKADAKTPIATPLGMARRAHCAELAGSRLYILGGRTAGPTGMADDALWTIDLRDVALGEEAKVKGAAAAPAAAPGPKPTTSARALPTPAAKVVDAPAPVAVAAAASGSSDEIGRLQEEIATLKKELAKSRVNMLKARRNDGGDGADVTAANERVKTLESQAEASDKERADLNEQVSSLKKQLAIAKVKAAKAVNDDSAVVTELQNQLKKEQDDRVKVDGELADAKRKLASGATELESLRKKCVDLEAERSELETTATTAVEEAEKRAEQAEADVAKLKAAASSGSASADESAARLEKELADAKAISSANDATSKRLQTELDAAKASATSLEKQLADAKKQVADAASSAGSASAKLQADVTALEKQLADAKATAGSGDATSKRLQTELDAAKAMRHLAREAARRRQEASDRCAVVGCLSVDQVAS
jgi:N-acetylneuraminic acid mutarotase/predicted  nucleic acid-binding Zn-ribbon protein